MLLTEREAAAVVQIDRRTLRRLIQSGRLRAVDIGSGKRRYYRIDPSDLRRIAPNVSPPESTISRPRPHRMRYSPHRMVESFLPSV